MSTPFKIQIKSLFNSHRELTVRQLVDLTGASKQMIHLILKEMVNRSEIEKLGKTPKTVYRLLSIVEEQRAEYNTAKQAKIPKQVLEDLKEKFLSVDNRGNLLDGYEAFSDWCKTRNLPVEKTIDEYFKTKLKYDKYYDKNGFISGNQKLRDTDGFDQIWLDELYYLDFYAIERFGKTRLGTLLHYAKQGQSKYLMKILVSEIDSRIKKFIKINKIDAVGFVPPTIRREVQLMKYFETHIQTGLPKLNIMKVSRLIPVPQKSLSKIGERIANADNTFALREREKYNRILLIDDAIGSGATLNQIAGKIKQQKIAKHITGLAIVGSFKGFDVIADI